VSALQKFYEALHSQKEFPSLIRVMHYGDSQIEGDRISDYLRLRLQDQFGGAGPGLISFMPLTASPSNYIAAGPGWERYSLYTAKDPRVPHNSYGALVSFCRFTPYKKRGDTSAVRTADLQIATTDLKGGSAPEYTKVKLFYGGSRTKTWCEFYDGPALVSADSLDRWGTCRVKEYPVLKGSNVHTFKFRGSDSPDFYALSLEGETGVMVDNIAMRGSSGTFFHQVDQSQMKQFYDHLNVKLVIMQFGGNTLPAIEDSVMAANYAEYMRYQLSLLKKLAPDASVLFIGPSDMSVKDGTNYVTHPYLEVMRDHLKRVILDAGCAFFDLYDVMGGRNSMPAWVDENLAGKDYTHFSPKGARKIGTLLYAALISDYNDYLHQLK
jgi:lysophospholipase L1-like esterase